MTDRVVFVGKVFEAADLKLTHFLNVSFAENLLWLSEIENEAKKAFGSTSISLLPKTPSMKRKRLIDSVNVKKNEHDSSNCCYTSDNETRKKKIKALPPVKTMFNLKTKQLEAKKRKSSLPFIKRVLKKAMRKPNAGKMAKTLEQKPVFNSPKILSKIHRSEKFKLNKINLSHKKQKENSCLTIDQTVFLNEVSGKVSSNCISISTSSKDAFTCTADTKNTYQGGKNNGISGENSSVANDPPPHGVSRESSYCCYGIDNLTSDDSTDEETESVKSEKYVPSWVKDEILHAQLLWQFRSNINPEQIFVNCMEPCNLMKIFRKIKRRYIKRTSSAQWSSPPLKKTIHH